MGVSESVTPQLYTESFAASPKERQAISRDLFRSVIALAEVSEDV
jgi:hypothetical protein